MVLKFRHIDTQQTLNTVKFSADSTNTTYFLHSSPSTQLQGAPDVNYEDICFIKPTGQEYTHGKLYGGENNNNFTDSFADYLNDLYSKVHTNIILTGGNWYELSETKKVTPGFVYIHTVGIVYVGTMFLTSISLSQSGEPSIYRYTFDENYESLPKKDWNYEYSYTAFSNPMPDYKPNFHIEKVCDWSDLKYLYKISIENASRVRDGLMSKEDKIKLDSHTDEYLDYLHKLCIEHSKDAIILSGCTVEPTGVQDTYQRKGGYVYIDSIGQIKKVNDGTISYSTTIEDSLYCNSQNGGNGKTYAFGAATNPSNLNNQYAKVCDWADLVRLSDLELPVATSYQRGLGFNVANYYGPWRNNITQTTQLDYWGLNKPTIPADRTLICYDVEINIITQGQRVIGSIPNGGDDINLLTMIYPVQQTVFNARLVAKAI